jgi:hypothetical protein
MFREASVATGGALTYTIGLDQDDLSIWSLFLGLQGCPKPRETASDNRQIGFLIAAERLDRGRALGAIEPIASRLGVSKGL